MRIGTFFPFAQKLFAIVLLITCASSMVRAQNFYFQTRDYNQIKTPLQLVAVHSLPDTLRVANDAWPIMKNNAAFGNSVKYKSNYTVVKLAIDHANKLIPPSPYVYRMVYRLEGCPDYTDTTYKFSATDTLTIGWHPDSLRAYQDMQVKVYPNLYRARLIVLQFFNYTNTSAPTAFNPNLAGIYTNFNVELAMLYQPYVKNIYGNNMGVSVSSTYQPTTQSLRVNWSPSTTPYLSPLMPVHYELEWFHRWDSLNSTPNTPSLKYDFDHNATRIITDKSSYDIPLIYRKGWIGYRVRMVRPDSVNYKTPIYGPWSVLTDAGLITSMPSSAKYYLANSHNGDSVNWNYTVSFAEGGKYKHVLGYYDGLLKNRQSVTRFNSDPNKVIVAEKIYDYEGRPQISTLPVPVSGQGLRYVPDVSLSSVTGLPYKASDFDVYQPTLCPTDPIAPPFAPTAAASLYYSPQNPDTADFQKYVPDAGGYPFVHTQLSPGYNDRVDKAGGAGDSLQIGMGHHMRHDYVGAEQTDLNLLFGLNAGWENFYHRTVSTDQNGQHSMVIKDYEGKPVATAMIGDAVDKNKHAIQRNDEVPDSASYKDDKLANANQLTVGNQRIYNKNFYMDVAGFSDVQYIYEFQPYPVCSNPYLGLSVKGFYDYSITDECGVVKLTDTGTLGTTGVVTSSTPPAYPGTLHSVSLQKGKHTLDKTLTVNTDEIYAAVDSFFAHKPNCLKTEDEFIREEVTSYDYPCIDTADDPCGRLARQMMEELFPNAKYGYYHRNSSGMVVGRVNKVDSQSIFDMMPNDKHRYKDPCVATELSKITIARFGTTYVGLDTMHVDRFLALYTGADRYRIAKALLPLHPEFCKLQGCWNDTFETRLQSIPNASIAEKYHLLDLDSLVAHDPLPLRMSLAPTYLTTVADSLKRFAKMWRIDSLAAEMAFCSAGDGTMYSDGKWAFRNDIAALSFPNEGVRNIYFERLRSLYSSNRMKYVSMLRDAPSTCPPCAVPRMKLIPAPLVPTLYTASGSLDMSSPSSLIGLMGGSMTSSMYTIMNNSSSGSIADQDSIQALADSVAAQYARANDTVNRATVDSMVSKLAGCYTTAGGKTALKNALLTVVTTYNIQFGKFQPQHVREAILNAGLSLGDLCHPYLVNYDYFDETSQKSLNCKSAQFFEDVQQTLDRQDFKSKLASPGGSAFSITLSGASLFESGIIAALGSAVPSYQLSSSYDAGGRLYRLFLYKAGGTDTVMVALRSGMNVTKGGNTYHLFENADSIFITSAECVRSDPQAVTDGYISSFSFFANVLRKDNTSSGLLTTTAKLLGWNNGKAATSEAGGSEIDRYVPYTQFRTLFQEYKDTMQVYNITGVDHPLYGRSMRSFMNYALQRSFGEDQYWRYLASSALTDSQRVRLYGGYTRYTASAGTLSALAANAAAAGVPLRTIVHYRPGGSGPESIIVNYAGLTNAEIAILSRLLPTDSSNKLLPLTPGNGVGHLLLPTGTYAVSVLPAALKASDSSNVQVWDNSAWKSYTRYHISESNSGTQPYVLTAAIGAVPDALYFGGIQGYWLPLYYAAVNEDYGKPEKKQLLSYTYGKQQRPVVKVLDSLQPPYLQTGVALFSNSAVSYQDPSNPHRFTNLFYTPPATALPGYSTLSDILGYATTQLGSGKLFIPVNTDSVNIPTYLSSPADMVAYRCHDGLYWYRFFNASHKLFNVFVRLPDYVYPALRPQLVYQSMRLSTGDSAARSFQLLLTTSALPGDTIVAQGYTDFDLAHSRKLSDVLLGNEADYSQGQNKEGIPNVSNNCEQDILYNAVYAGKIRYRFYIDSARDAMRTDFYAHVMSQIKEKLYLSYMDQRFAITLYHYDRAGNLVRTVPPEGVHKLPVPFLPQVDPSRTAASNSLTLVPLHTKQTVNVYNSLNQLKKTTTPDGGTTRYWYDLKGNMTFGQTDKQWGANKHTYFLYDAQNRLVETGEVDWGCASAPIPWNGISTTPPMPCLCLNAESGYWEPCLPNTSVFGHDQIRLDIRKKARTQVVYTVYDDTLINLSNFAGMSPQQGLRNRVAAVAYYDNVPGSSTSAPPPKNTWLHCTHYSYDAAGNVATLTQDFPELDVVHQRHKRVDYDYDLYSGKVNMVAYNRSFTDQYYQRYGYDADNRIVKVETSGDGIIWKRDAEYKYYQHGPLARTSLGDLRVQGLDYAYTISGWLKSINAQAIDTTTDMGGDGRLLTSIHPQDAYATTLDYFKGDYRPIGTRAIGALEEQSKGLFNGNIARQTTDLNRFGAVTAQFGYDQLNRLRKTVYGTQGLGAAAITWNNAFASAYRYDQDGNILSLVRRTGTAALMDSLDYQYVPGGGNNRLQEVLDFAPASPAGREDIARHTTPATRMLYDPTGNLVKDLTSSTDTVWWNIYGKATGLKNNTARLTMGFGYDGTGQRVIKRERRDRDTGYVQEAEYYIRDAGGNILAVYRNEKQYKYVPLQIFKEAHKGLTPADLGNVIGNVLVPDHALHPAFAASVTSAVGTLSPMPVGFYLKSDPALGQQFILNGTGVLNALWAYTRSSGGIPVGGRSVSARLAAAASDGQGNPTPEVEADAFTDLGNLISVHPQAEVRAYSLGQLRSQWGGAFNTLMQNYGQIVSGDSATDVTALADAVMQNPQATGAGLLTHYDADRQVQADSLNGWLAHFASDSLYYADGWHVGGGMVPYMQTSLETHGYHVGLDTFANHWSGAWDILHSLTDTSALQKAQYFDDPGAFLMAQVSLRGTDFLDTALAAMELATPPLGGGGSDPYRYMARIVKLSDHTLATQAAINWFTTVLNLHRHSLEEHHLYGSARLGIKGYWPGQIGSTWDFGASLYDTGKLALRLPWWSATYAGLLNVTDMTASGPGLSSATGAQHLLGQKQYELVSHLGNVQVTASDKRYGVDVTSDGKRDRWSSVHPAIYDYYPYGMLIPERTTRDTTSQCAVVTQTKYVPTLTKIPLNIAPAHVLLVGGIPPGWVSFTSGGNVVISTAGSGHGVNIALSSTSGQVAVYINNISGSAFSLSVVQGSTVLASSVADVGGVEIPLVYSGSGSGGTVSLEITALDAGPATVDVLASRWVTTWAPQTVLTTVCNGVKDRYRFGINEQEKLNSIAGIGNHTTALFGEYNTRLARRWNIDPKPNASVSSYSVFGGNPILISDIDLDTPRVYANAQMTNKTLSDKGGVNERSNPHLGAENFKDAKINPVYSRDGKTLTGYYVYDNTKPELEHPILQLDPGDLPAFKENYRFMFGGAQLFYAGGEQSKGLTKMSAGLLSGDWRMVRSGIAQANREAWSDPMFVLQMITSAAHAGASILEGPKLKSYSGTTPGKGVGEPNSIYTYRAKSNGKAVSNYIYNSSGKCVFQVDFQSQPNAMSGHGHQMKIPGNLGSGHGPGTQHIPHNQVPLRYLRLPRGVTPSTYIGY